jgi:hypothetical protein
VPGLILATPWLHHVTIAGAGVAIVALAVWDWRRQKRKQH